MKPRSLNIAIVLGFALSAVVVAGTASAHPTESAGTTNAPPSAAFSTSGDYATDVLGNPWDFSDDADVPAIPIVGTENSFGISRANEVLTVDAQSQSTIKLIRTWGAELPWGHDGLAKPADAAVYSHLSFRMDIGQKRNMGIHYWTESGQQNIVGFTVTGPGWANYDIDLAAGQQLLGPSVWSGKIVRLEILAGSNDFGGPARFNMDLDWARLHRANVAPTPDNSPVVRVTNPSDEGGADYATVNGNPWDFAGGDDVASTGDLRISSFDGNMHGTTIGNDSFVELPLPSLLNPDRYHRATVEVCYGGPFSFANAPGGGMNARLAWLDDGAGIWSETQDIVIYPGCNRMTFDLATNPALAVNDEDTVHKAGWRGLHISRLRFDLNEYPAARDFALNDIRLADDAAFSSGTFPIKFNSSVAGSADIFVTTDQGLFNGTKIGTMNVAAGTNTFDWNGAGYLNGTYWVYTVVRGGGGVGSAFSTGPVRIERSVSSPTSSCYVPLNPARLLDTRTGEGGNNSALAGGALTEMKVTGVGNVPPTGATAVVLNVTAADPITSGFVTAWPSGEPQPPVSNLNYVAGQTVPNLVTVKVGANGRVNLFNSEGYTQVLADVVGYYTAATSCNGRFTAVTPGRVLDTRFGTGTGGSTAPVGPGQSINVQVTGLKDVPAVGTGVSGVALNVTADSPTAEGYLTVWPSGEPQPGASSHNFVPGRTVANLVLAKVGTNGQVSIFNSAGSTHVVADVVGYFSAGGGLFVPVSPQRIVDSRSGLGTVAGPLGQAQSVNVSVAGVSPVPATAKAAIVNVTSTDASQASFITVWPTGTAMPTASTLNPRPGVAVPNLAYLKLGVGGNNAGKLSIYNDAGSTNYIVDVFGYIA